MADVHTIPLTPFYIDASRALLGGTAAEKKAARDRVLHEFTVNKKLHGFYNEMKILDLKGNQLASLVGSTANESGKTWFKEALAHARESTKGGACHDLYVSSVEYCGELGLPSIHMAHVIRDRATFEPISMIVVDVNVDKIQKLMDATTGLGETGQTYLVGPDKVMRSNDRHSTDPTIFKKRVDTAGVGTVFARHEARRGAEFCETAVYPDDRGVPVLGHNHFLPELDLAVMTEIDEAEAFGAVTRIQIAMAVVGVIALAAILGASLLIARILCGPINGNDRRHDTSRRRRTGCRYPGQGAEGRDRRHGRGGTGLQGQRPRKGPARGRTEGTRTPRRRGKARHAEPDGRRLPDLGRRGGRSGGGPRRRS